MMKNPLLAQLYYEKALKLFPQYAITHAQYGSYLVGIGNSKAGIAQLEKAVEMNPRLMQAHTWLAQAYAKSGNAERARQVTERARELQSGGELPSRGESNTENSSSESHNNQ